MCYACIGVCVCMCVCTCVCMPVHMSAQDKQASRCKPSHDWLILCTLKSIYPLDISYDVWYIWSTVAVVIMICDKYWYVKIPNVCIIAS